MALDQFLIGVKAAEPIKQQLLMSSPKKMEEAIRKVRQLETAQLLLRQGPGQAQPDRANTRIKVASATTGSTTSTTAATGTNTTKPGTELGQVLELLQKMELRLTELEKKQVTPSDASCWRCNSSEHRPSNCPTLVCYNCHENGHMSKFCPKKMGNHSQGSSRGRPTSSQ